jgi:exosortase D (VPLPA-CTERM-specific)
MAIINAAAPAGERVLTSRAFLARAVFVGCLIIIFLTARDGLTNLYYRWSHEDEYGYGFLIAALVPLLLWRQWPGLMHRPQDRAWIAVLLTMVGQVCAILGVAGESFLLEQIGLIISLFGLGMVFFGTAAARALLPIALLLVLTLPLPFTLQAMLTIKLQLISTDLGVAIIQLLGIPVYVEGNIIDLGVYKLQVAEACSGLRYLLPLTCISVLVAYLYRAPFWKKATLVISAAPLTVLINSVRIAITAILVDNFGISMAEGFLHEFEGWLVFLVGVVCLVLEIFVLERFRWSNVEIEPLLERSPPSTAGRNPLARPLFPLAIVAAACVASFAFASYATADYGSAALPNRQPLAELQTAIGGWSGRSDPLDQATVDLLKATDYYAGDFSEKLGVQPVNLFVAYYDTLSKNAAIHSPRVCLPGSGWEFASFQERPFSDLIPGKEGTYNRVIIQKGEQKILMYYWYQQRERNTANEFSMKYYLLVDGFLRKRKDGALVRVLTPIGDNGVGAPEARLTNFVRSLSPKLVASIPQ